MIVVSDTTLLNGLLEEPAASGLLDYEQTRDRLVGW